MKISIGNAKVMLNKACLAMACHIQITRAVIVFTITEMRLEKLHPVRDARKRESINYTARSNLVAFELACKKLSKI
ncbi:hypothetical protein [Pseudomonas syringae]|uniref:hypothetical protein n=1 Tax=Pseudomonas syringae TaxID=317 RepID=UPI001F2617B7|nr:hypothetical protein [Pseudomonas syringae]MCF5371305.1 hypothetical protein [Pseudomonas syringae]MCF5382098.1 hypothetical protein [Pseudomonas syringae]MCF5422927.1 hypothetical protein [Pseudomonas syringae]MCF5460123.1 hypothetical protein [Pseudomonas syringae]